MKRTFGRITRKLVLASAACAALLLGAAASASAGTLDQQQTSFTTSVGMYATSSLAQTFTAGISGGLDQADLLLVQTGSQVLPVTVEIRNTSAGLPGTSVLASAAIPASAIGTDQAFVPATFATPAAVTAGTQYALVAYNTFPSNNYGGWYYKAATDPYSGGAAFESSEPAPPQGGWIMDPGDDFAFKTYVTPPPPAGTTHRKKCKKKHKRSARSAKKKCKKKKRK